MDGHDVHNKLNLSFFKCFAFIALTLLVSWQERHPVCKKLTGEVLVWLCLRQGADLHMAQLMPLQLNVSCFSKTYGKLVLPFWCQLTWVVSDKGPLNGCCCCCF